MNSSKIILPAGSQQYEKSARNSSRYLSSPLLKNKLSHDLLKVDAITTVKDKIIPGLKLIESRNNMDTSAMPFDPSTKRHLRSHFRVMFFAAPEFSFSREKRISSPGSDLGMALSFHFKKTISLSAGLLASKKKYVSSGSEYAIKEGYWRANTNSVVPDKIFGSCSIVEIPLMLQLRILEIKKHHLFISSGTSSYLMLNESYNYKFDQPNPGAKDSWASEKSTIFAFSAINLSMSYERNISNSITIGLEPYAKLPVKKIGWPNLELFSSGVNFLVRYKMLNK